MIIKCDGKIYNPLGGGSYVFEKEIIPYILSKIQKNKLKIGVGAQPNSSPHFGTLTGFILAFILAERMASKSASVLFDVVDTAPGETTIIDEVKYQKSLKVTGIIDKYMNQYIEILEYLKLKTGVNYEIRYQSEFNNQKEIKNNFKLILEHREKIAKILDPKYNNLRVRISCPYCGITDKNSVKNEYNDTIITSYCPEHGAFKTDIDKNSSVLEYNTPLRNLVRGMAFGDINQDMSYDYEIMRLIGSDYAGFYQEELLYRASSILGYPSHKLPIIFYAPLITDWSGAKLSKSLYVKEGAYSDLPNEFISYEFLKKKYDLNGLDIIYNIVSTWVDNPYMLFRHYSIYYFIEEFKKYE